MLFSICCILGMAQTKVSGTVKNNKGKPLPAVSITLKDTYDGATSDSSGKFSFTTAEKGKLAIVATAVGYKPYEQEFDIGVADITLDISLREQVSELKAVVITAGSFEAGDRKRVTVLSSIDVATTAEDSAFEQQWRKATPLCNARHRTKKRIVHHHAVNKGFGLGAGATSYKKSFGFAYLLSTGQGFKRCHHIGLLAGRSYHVN